MRLPRKRKKQVKKIVARKNAIKMTMTAVTVAQSWAQMAVISATPSITSVPEKALKVVQITSDTAKAIGRIMSEPPNSWKDFIR